MSRILLIEAIHPELREQKSFISMGLGYLASYLRAHEPATEIRIINSGVTKALDRFRPELAGISSVSQNFGWARKLAIECKKRGIYVVAGGCHLSALPESLSPEMDLGVKGEGEETFLEVLRSFNASSGTASLRSIPGTFHRDSQGRISLAPCRPPIEPLDRIPFPSRDLLPSGNQAAMITSRGCPYRCSFCASTLLWPATRYFSAGYVAEEIELLFKRYGRRYIEIWDDLFIADRQRMDQVIQLLEKRGILGKVGFAFAVRANLVDADLIERLVRMNVQLVSMGFESMSEESLAFLNKSQVSPSQNLAAAEQLHAAGIKVTGSFIIGSPGEKETDILRTLDFLRQAPMHNFKTYLLTPLPGTRVWEAALAKGQVGEGMDWSRLSVEPAAGLRRSVLVSETLSRRQLSILLSRFRREEAKKSFALWTAKITRGPGWAWKRILR